MVEASNAGLSSWENFYVIVGSSSAALIGLQFVVITLVAQTHALRATPGTISAFATPTVVHFAGALLVSAVMSTPWPSLEAAGIALAACGVAGVGYGVRVVLRARRQTAYEPEWSDWVWHVVLPDIAYVALAIAGCFVHAGAHAASFVVAAAALGLLFIGIHNAWDTVTYVVAGAGANKTPPTHPK